MAKQGFEAAGSNKDLQRKEYLCKYSSPTSMAKRGDGRRAAAAKAGPPPVATVEKENGIEDVLVYAGRHCLGITRQRLGENIAGCATTFVPCTLVLLGGRRGLPDQALFVTSLKHDLRLNLLS